MPHTSVPTVTLNNGLEMPQLGFGVYKVSNDDAATVVTHAIEAGYRSIDTAALYGNEQGVGQAIAQTSVTREDLFITSKLWPKDFTYEGALRGYETSLEKLGLEKLDLYLLHWPAPATDSYLEAWRALTQLYAEGRVGAIGVSNFLPEHLARLGEVSDIVPVVNQIELHPLFQNRASVAANTARGIVTEAWSPLAQGAALSHPAVVEIADRLGVTSAQVILHWHLQQGRVIIPKSQTPSRMASNLDLFGFELSETDLAVIDSLDSAEGRVGPNPAEFNG
ncbi:aldo/keto reductase [Leucobacter sp. cx-328]|uniref:aldo/keto reductase n=1 Tax=unclassified Leucobacter TaxID=2621730 RepID=UPI00165E2ABD|nr:MULTISPECIES: aldo/keto reductase [unclassified Leucobacter]MBC9943938.1 aldo/keto reductase [Leucobacter sp. cx-328]